MSASMLALALATSPNPTSLYVLVFPSVSPLALTQVCADIMIRGIPLRRLFYSLDWTLAFVSRVYSLCPPFFETLTRLEVARMNKLFL